MSITNPTLKVITLAGKFVMKNKGTWEHEEWLGFAEEAAGLGFELNDENKRNLGNLLEASKMLYHNMASNGGMKKTTTRASARKKTGTRTKAKATSRTRTSSKST